MVGKWRSRFLKARREGLYDETRPGAPRQGKGCPRGADGNSDLGKHTSGRDVLEHARPGQGYRAQPHDYRPAFGTRSVWNLTAATFKRSPDPCYVRDMVGVYMNPLDHALFLCVDEKTQIQGLDRTQPLPPMQPVQLQRRTRDYKCQALAAGLSWTASFTGKWMAPHSELGHRVIDSSGRPRSCRFRRCRESLATGSTMVTRVKSNVVAGCACLQDVTAKRICELAQHCNETARPAVEREAY